MARAKRILITGVISNRSIAYGIAQACRTQGAELAFTYAGERFKDRVSDLAAELGSKIVLACDVAEDAQIEGLMQELQTHWDSLDGLVHSIGFAPREAIAGNFLDGLSREAFRIAQSGRPGPVLVDVAKSALQAERDAAEADRP